MSPLGNFKMLRQFVGLLTDREAGDWSSPPVTGRRRRWGCGGLASCHLPAHPRTRGGGGPAQTSCSFWGLGLELGKQASFHPATHSRESGGLRRFV